MNHLSRAQILLLVAVIGIGIAILYVADEPEEKPIDVDSVRGRIQVSIETQGPEKAYLLFKESIAMEDPDTQHNTTHILGESLYDVVGRSGLSVCDTSFNFGCYHGFFTRAVVREGLSIVSSLDEVCQSSSAPSICQHGLGHGILEYLGYSKLTEALETCTRTYQPDPLAGCTSGVFMEYNVPLVVEGEQYSVVARPLVNEDEPYSPCTEIAAEFQQSCYHELPQWWNQVFEGDFARMGVACDTSKYEEICFSGVGNIAGSNGDYSVEKTIAICDTMPSSSGRSLCLVSAGGAFVSNIGDRDGARGLCNALPVSEQETCLSSI